MNFGPSDEDLDPVSDVPKERNRSEDGEASLKSEYYEYNLPGNTGWDVMGQSRGYSDLSMENQIGIGGEILDARVTNPIDYYQSRYYAPDIKNSAPIFLARGEREERVLNPSERMHLISLVQFLRMGQPEYLSAGPCDKNDDGGSDGVTGKQLRVEVEKTLLVPPQHFIKHQDLRVDTETQVLDAFNSALIEWRMRNSGDDKRPELRDETSDTKNLRADMGDAPIKVYAWRASPTLNWCLKGYCAQKEFYQTYSDAVGDNVVYIYDEPDEDVESASYAQVPYPNLVTNISERLEVIMLAYRYACIVINRVVRELDMSHVGGKKGDSGASSGGGSEKFLVTQRDAIRDNMLALMRVYRIMQSLVTPLIAGWNTLVYPPPVAELSQECCLMFQYLVYSIRLQYCGRLQKIYWQLETELVRDKKTTGAEAGVESSMYLYGHGVIKWAKLNMGTAISMLEAIELFNGPISMGYGDLPCPGHMKYDCYSPHRSVVVDRFRSYMTDVCLLFLTRSLNLYVVYAEDMFGRLSEKFPVQVYPEENEEGIKRRKKRAGEEDLEKFRNMAVAMSQIGLTCTRAMLTSGGSNVEYAGKAEVTFNRVIAKMYPDATQMTSGIFSSGYDDNGSSEYDTEADECQSGEVGDDVRLGMLEEYRASQGRGEPSGSYKSGLEGPGRESGMKKRKKEFRVCDEKGLLAYMECVSDFFSDEHCEFLTDVIGDETIETGCRNNSMFFYNPAVRPGLTLNHLTRSAVYLKGSGEYGDGVIRVKKRTDDGTISTGLGTGGKEMMYGSETSKEIWKKMVYSEARKI